MSITDDMLVPEVMRIKSNGTILLRPTPTYWDLYCEVKQNTYSQAEFNIAMAKVRQEYLKRRPRPRVKK